MKRSEILRQRLLSSSKGFLECSDKAIIYAKCVTASKSPKPQECQKEFESLSQCVRNAMKKGMK